MGIYSIHLQPDDQQVNFCLGVLLKEYYLHRTGANLNSIGSGWGEDGQKLDGARGSVERIFYRLKGIIQFNHD
jgi:hypothetical protein